MNSKERQQLRLLIVMNVVQKVEDSKNSLLVSVIFITEQELDST